MTVFFNVKEGHASIMLILVAGTVLTATLGTFIQTSETKTGPALRRCLFQFQLNATGVGLNSEAERSSPVAGSKPVAAVHRPAVAAHRPAAVGRRPVAVRKPYADPSWRTQNPLPQRPGD